GLTRRQFLVGVAALGAGGLAYTRWCEPHWLEVGMTRVPLARSNPGRPVRVLHLSDFHASRVVSLEFIAHSIELGLAQRPDFAVLTGDFITAQYEAPREYARVLRSLSAAVPTFACLGNHDGGSWAAQAGGYDLPDRIMALLADAQIPCLFNQARSLAVAGQSIQLFGAGDLWARDCHPERAFAELPERMGAWRLVLSHNPDAKDLFIHHDWDLMFCGHTHGGQLRLPLLGAPLAPVVDKRFVEGLHRWENRWLHVTRGVGNLHGLRFNCRPQVSLLDLG
ncbi:MAG TPA: phosphodiesterase YaeI, partial [Candidatus Didemnitutus sp.]|nr:phosphodiesterase YaeI [Candidatus Didemnitutus sp.]